MKLLKILTVNLSEIGFLFSMKTFIATILAITALAASMYAQEMPADLKTKLEARAAELNPDNANKAKSWVRKQSESWEAIQNMTFSIDEKDIALIKNMAMKKFPLDFTAQESFIGEQASSASELADYKIKVGTAVYEELRKQFEASGQTSISKFAELLQIQCAAKGEIDAIDRGTMRQKTYEILKKVVAQEFPGNFDEQIKTIKEILNGAKSTDDVENASKDMPVKEKRLTMSDIEKNSRKIFLEQSFLTDGEKRAIVTYTEIQGKKVLMMPFSAYNVGVTISNPRGEQIEYNENDVYIGKEFPIVLLFIKSVPEGSKPATFVGDKECRDLVGQNVFLAGYLKDNILSYPIKITSINDNFITPSSKIPPRCYEGTIFLTAPKGESVAVAINYPSKLRRVNWLQRGEVNRIIRDIEMQSFGDFRCARFDKFTKWEKFSDEKYLEQKMRFDRLKGFAGDILSLFTASNMVDLENKAYIGQIVKKHMPNLKHKMDKPRFERLFKAFMQDIAMAIKLELKEIGKTEFYSGYQIEMKLYIDILEQGMKVYETASKSQTYMELVQEDIKRFQTWQ